LSRLNFWTKIPSSVQIKQGEFKRIADDTAAGVTAARIFRAMSPVLSTSKVCVCASRSHVAPVGIWQEQHGVAQAYRHPPSHDRSCILDPKTFIKRDALGTSWHGQNQPCRHPAPFWPVPSNCQNGSELPYPRNDRERGISSRVVSARLSSASIAANSFSMARADGSPSVSFR
jgi:hypothetical protein